MKDQYGRSIEYMRISVTDRCNLRCEFCMPDGTVCFKNKEEVLSFEEYKEIVKAAVTLGIHKFRITGGEPLVREGVVSFISELKQLDGVEGVYLTTNGVLLEDKLEGLLAAGIDGINVSLCSTDSEEYKRITGRDFFLKVMRGIEKAIDMGIHIKINTVPLLKRNEGHLMDIASLAKDRPVDVRFIEMMPIGRGASYDMISNEKIAGLLDARFGQAVQHVKVDGNGPAVYRKYPGFAGNIGFISARTCEFCGTCNRVRVSADGYLKLCLNYDYGADLKPFLKGEHGKQKLIRMMEETIYRKPAHHCFNASKMAQTANHISKKYMAQIGG